MAKRGSFFSDSFGLFKQTFSEWLEDKAPQLGAALAYYTVFSLALLILVLLAIVGLIFRSDPGGAWNKITEQMSYFLDKSAVEVVQNIAQKAAEPNKSLLAMIIGIGLSCRLHCLTPHGPLAVNFIGTCLHRGAIHTLRNQMRIGQTLKCC
jgi:uncharacterized BrkB/YihY/UPF0761 family membrane protein